MAPVGYVQEGQVCTPPSRSVNPPLSALSTDLPGPHRCCVASKNCTVINKKRNTFKTLEWHKNGRHRQDVLVTRMVAGDTSTSTVIIFVTGLRHASDGADRK